MSQVTRNAHGDADCLGCAAADSSRHDDLSVVIAPEKKFVKEVALTERIQLIELILREERERAL